MLILNLKSVFFQAERKNEKRKKQNESGRKKKLSEREKGWGLHFLFTEHFLFHVSPRRAEMERRRRAEEETQRKAEEERRKREAAEAEALRAKHEKEAAMQVKK